MRHHLIDILDLSEDFTVGMWLRQAHLAIADVLSRGRVPVIVGGTMLYAQWLVHGKPDAPAGGTASLTAVEEVPSQHES